jgi:hypothetical protein
VVPRLITWLVAAASLLGCGSPTPDRGIYFWARTGADSPAADQVVGDPVLEELAVQEFARLGITRVYTSLNDRPVTEPAVVAAWNRRLHAAGIRSDLLMSENTWLFECRRSGLLRMVGRRFVTFNAGRSDPAERFIGLHLDIEPHGLRGALDCDTHEVADWGSMSIEAKRGYVQDLVTTLEEVRQLLDGAGLAHAELHADIPLWLDELHEPSNPEQGFYWSSGREREAWFAALSQPLAGVTVMAYCRRGRERLDAAVQDEVARFRGQVRVGLSARSIAPRADSCPAPTWQDVPDLLTGIAGVEQRLGKRIGGVDVYSFSWLQDRAGGMRPTP